MLDYWAIKVFAWRGARVVLQSSHYADIEDTACPGANGGGLIRSKGGEPGRTGANERAGAVPRQEGRDGADGVPLLRSDHSATANSWHSGKPGVGWFP